MRDRQVMFIAKTLHVSEMLIFNPCVCDRLMVTALFSMEQIGWSFSSFFLQTQMVYVGAATCWTLPSPCTVFSCPPATSWTNSQPYILKNHPWTCVIRCTIAFIFRWRQQAVWRGCSTEYQYRNKARDWICPGRVLVPSGCQWQRPIKLTLGFTSESAMVAYAAKTW
jgi:hypothetical protein